MATSVLLAGETGVNTDGPGVNSADASTYTLGMEFELSESAQLTAIYFWRAPLSAGGGSEGPVPTRCGIFNVVTHPGPGNEDFPFDDPGPGVTGWIRQAVNGPVLDANTRYKACVYAAPGVNWFSSTSHYWDGTGPGSNNLGSGIITAFNQVNATAGQDTFIAGGAGIQYPGDSFNSTNYTLGVEVSTSPPIIPSQNDLFFFERSKASRHERRARRRREIYG